MKADNLRNGFIWNSIGSTINACVSLFLMIVVTRINGINDAGIFTFGYSLACLLQVIATYSGRPFQVTEINENIKDSDFFWCRILTSIITLIVGLLFVSIKGYDIYKIIIILMAIIYRISDAISDCFYGILQKNEKLDLVGKSLFIKGIINSILFIVTDLIFKNLILSFTLLIIINILISFFYDYLNVKKINFKVYNINKTNIKYILIKGFSVFLYTILIQYLVSAQKYVIDNVLEESYQTIFGILLMPASVMVLISQFIVLPFLTSITKYIKEHDKHNINKITCKLSLSIFIVCVLGIIVSYFIGVEVLSFVYSIDLTDYRLSLVLILIGSGLFALSYVLSSIMTTMRYNTSQLVIYIIVSIFTYIISNYFISNFGIQGSFLAYLISMILLFVLYLIVFNVLKKGFFNENIDNSTSI